MNKALDFKKILAIAIAVNPPNPAPKNPLIPRKASSREFAATRPNPAKVPEVRRKASLITKSSETEMIGTREKAMQALNPSQKRCLVVLFCGAGGKVYILYRQKILAGIVINIGAIPLE